MNGKVQEYSVNASSMTRENNLWSLLVIAKGRKGTHDSYDVLFNSQCRSNYFKSKDDALEKSREVIEKDGGDSKTKR